MGLKIEYIEGQTPLDEDEKEGLLVKTISTKGELDEFEQLNIQSAIEWSLKTKVGKKQFLTEDFLMLVHKKMFGEVWAWAGTKRKSNKNIGVDKTQISIEIRKLIDDCNFWIDHQSFTDEEIAIRFSHRLVKIHLFPNGNGRHSRLAADIMISKLFNRPVFSWGHSDLSKKNPIRKEYLDAIYKADNDDYKPLLEFAKK
ncbi:MAG: mobile mystery protein B [Bacteroidetes bacterium]|nr:mobile mystery protein B [Bacteroidota bacterium]